MTRVRVYGRLQSDRSRVQRMKNGSSLSDLPSGWETRHTYSLAHSRQGTQCKHGLTARTPQTDAYIVQTQPLFTSDTGSYELLQNFVMYSKVNSRPEPCRKLIPGWSASQQTVIVAKYLLQLFSRYWALSVLGLRLDLSRSRDRHRSRDHSIPRRPFPIGGPLETSLHR